jgi:hypothetical protein
MTLGDLTSSFDLLAGSGATGYNQGVKNSKRFTNNTLPYFIA